jgi:hypothetical protein
LTAISEHVFAVSHWIFTSKRNRRLKCGFLQRGHAVPSPRALELAPTQVVFGLFQPGNSTDSSPVAILAFPDFVKRPLDKPHLRPQTLRNDIPEKSEDP